MLVPLALSIAGLVVALLAAAWVYALAQRVRTLASGRGDLARMAGSGDFIGVAQVLEERIDQLARADETLAGEIASLSDRLHSAVRHIGLVRFDALPGDVGEQSFVVALLDDAATGFVLTSMHGRGAYRLYAKPLTGGVAELALTDEETEAATRALEGTGLNISGQGRSRRGGG